jgi:hypothetical protein
MGYDTATKSTTSHTSADTAGKDIHLTTTAHTTAALHTTTNTTTTTHYFSSFLSGSSGSGTKRAETKKASAFLMSHNDHYGELLSSKKKAPKWGQKIKTLCQKQQRV